MRANQALSGSAEADIVLDHGVRADRHLPRIRQIELAEHDLVAPDLAQEIFEDVDGELLARTAPVAEAERREAGIVANRKAFAVNGAEDRAEATIGDVGLAAILHREIGDVERTAGKADLSAFVFGDLRAGRNAQIPCRIERVRVLPMHRIEARARMRRADIAVPLQRNAEPFL